MQYSECGGFVGGIKKEAQDCYSTCTALLKKNGAQAKVFVSSAVSLHTGMQEW